MKNKELRKGIWEELRKIRLEYNPVKWMNKNVENEEDYNRGWFRALHFILDKIGETD